MDIEIRPSPLSSFLVGAVVFIPWWMSSHLSLEGIIESMLLSITVAVYIVLIFLFVFGPMHWEKFGFYPNDGIEKAVLRGVFWVIGGATSMVTMELTNAL